ncbi:MAG: hypothetical protein R2851_21875 [Caldilineaceae bacterium]
MNTDKKQVKKPLLANIICETQKKICVYLCPSMAKLCYSISPLSRPLLSPLPAARTKCSLAHDLLRQFGRGASPVVIGAELGGVAADGGQLARCHVRHIPP